MIKSLEGIRGIAALIVALFHLKIGIDYFSIIRYGYLFVDLFFVLSGFVICSAYVTKMKKITDFWPFLIRRTGRLLPLLVFSTVAFLLVSNLAVLAKRILSAYGFGSALNNPQALEYLVPTAMEILSTLTFTHSLGVFDHLILNTPSWSISTEFYTYFLFAATCLLASSRNPVSMFAALGTAGLVISLWASTGIHNCMVEGDCLSLTYDFGFARCIYSFFLGTLTYYSSRRLRFDPAHLQTLALTVLFLLFAVLNYLPAAAFAIPPAYAVLVLSICRDVGFLSEILKLKPFQMIGQRSYSIYLMHVPLVLFFQNMANRAHGTLASTAVLGAYVVVLIVVSGWTYRFVESPLRLVFNRFAEKSVGSGSRSITERI